MQVLFNSLQRQKRQLRKSLRRNGPGRRPPRSRRIRPLPEIGPVVYPVTGGVSVRLSRLQSAVHGGGSGPLVQSGRIHRKKREAHQKHKVKNS